MILNLIYDFLKLLIRTIIRVFYPATIIIQKKRLHFETPTIVVSNHPNTLLDPIGVAALVRKRVFFLANAGLFKNPVVGWILDHFFCIPIMRKQDKAVKAVDNNASFQRAFQHLANNGSMYIAPEGGSFVDRRLRPLKSGTARIALGAEAEHNWALNITILPVGLSYTAGNKFRSRLAISIGESIIIRDFRLDYEEDNFKAVKKLTTLLDKRMRSLIIDTLDDTEDDFIQKVEKIHLSSEKNLRKVFKKTQENIQYFSTFSAVKKEAWIDTLTTYFQDLQSSKTTDKAIFLYQKKATLSNTPLRILLLIIGFPFFIYGAINHLFAVGIPYAVNKKMNPYIGYHATIKTMVGLFTFPIFYYLQYKCVDIYFGGWIALTYLLTLYPLGVLAWKYRHFFHLTKELVQWAKLSEEKKEAFLIKRNHIQATFFNQ